MSISAIRQPRRPSRRRSGAWLLLAAIAALLGGGAWAADAQREPKRTAADDLRPIYATASDVAEGRRVAEGSCSRCHGPAGISSASGVPSLAGQRPAYLYAKLRAYQHGARVNHPMEGAVRFLNDDALVKVSAYFGSLEPAQPAAADAAKPAAARPDPVAAGKAAAASCGGCHGEAGVTRTPGMPSLVGLDPKYFIAAMNAYKGGQRRHDMMKSLAAPLGDAEIASIALHYALQKPARAPTPAPGDAKAGKAAAAACAGCHGERGNSSTPATPSLAGQDAQYFAAAMQAYKDGSRKDDVMKGVAAGLDDKAVRDVAAFYAAQDPRPPKVEKPMATADWVQRCDRCHGVNGNSTDPRVPALAAQRVEYLEQALRAYQGGKRKGSVMSAMAAALTDSDVAALASYYARQRARAFVYVPVPAR